MNHIPTEPHLLLVYLFALVISAIEMYKYIKHLLNK